MSAAAPLSPTPRRAPRLVRLTPRLTCPVCDRLVYHTTVREGQSWIECSPQHRDHRGACRGHWLDLALPPGATGAVLQAIVGREAAGILLALAEPRWGALGADAFGALALVPLEATEPAHLQLVTERRIAHHHRHAALPHILRALGLSDTARARPARTGP